MMSLSRCLTNLKECAGFIKLFKQTLKNVLGWSSCSSSAMKSSTRGLVLTRLFSLKLIKLHVNVVLLQKTFYKYTCNTPYKMSAQYFSTSWKFECRALNYYYSFGRNDLKWFEMNFEMIWMIRKFGCTKQLSFFWQKLFVSEIRIMNKGMINNHAYRRTTGAFIMMCLIPIISQLADTF